METAPIDFTGFDFLQDAIDGEIETVELVEVFKNLRFRRQQRSNLVAAFKMRAQLIERDQIEQVGYRDGQRVGVRIGCQRQEVMSPRQMLRGQRDGFRVSHDMGQIDAGFARVLCQDIAQHAVVDEAQIDQLAAQRQTAGRLLHQRNAQLIRTDQSLSGEPFA
jgi:hypothetical protein